MCLNQSGYKAVVFDLDGTLVDSAPLVASILNGMREEQGGRPIELSYYREWSSEGGATLIGKALEVGADRISEFLQQFRERYFALPTPRSSVFPGVLDALTSLKARGIRLGICSNKPEHLCHKVLRETELESSFDVVVGGDTLEKRKPDRAPLLFAIDRLAVETSDVLFVGDSGIDHATSLAASVDFLLYPSGYDTQIVRDETLAFFPHYDLLAGLVKGVA